MTREIAFPMLIVAAVLFCCTNSNNVEPYAGGGVLNGNPIVSGVVTTENGFPSKNTIIKLVPSSNNPLEADTVTAYTITNDSGKYSFDSVGPGIYTVFGETVNKTLSFKNSITVDASRKIVSTDIIKIPGAMKGVIKLHPYRSCMVLILLLGTNTYMSTVDTIGNFISPKIPEGTYTVVVLSTFKEFSDTTISVTVKSNHTTLLDTIRLNYEGGIIDSAMLKRFQVFKENLPGSYTGIATTPWVAPYGVAFIIDSNGHYSAYNTSSTDYPALYYGTDKDASTKQISLVDINANGHAEGTINVIFDYDGIPGSPIIDKLKELYFSSDFDSLYFDMYHFDRYGPIKFTLKRKGSDSLPPHPLPTPEITVSGQIDPDPTKAQMLYFVDSVTIVMKAKEECTLIYQIIPVPPSCNYISAFPGDQYWDEKIDSKTYTGSILINQKNIDIIVLVRAMTTERKSSVAGYRIRIN
jgi:hypothetical protein